MRIAPQAAPASQPASSETPQAARPERTLGQRAQELGWAAGDALEKGAAATLKGAGTVAAYAIGVPAAATLTAIPGALLGGAAGAVLGACVAGAEMLAGGDPVLARQLAQYTTATCMAGGVVASWVGFASGHLGFGGGDGD
jgi:hypothetical protein